MDFAIRIEGLDKVVKSLNDLEKRQVPFATAKALTMTEKDAQAEVLESLPKQFTLRTAWYKPSSPLGFKITPATKTKLQSEIYTKAPFMSLQETGGIKTPKGEMIAVPTENVRRSKKDRILRSQRPAYLLHQAKRRAFIMKQGIWQRTGRGRGTLRLMYALVPKAKISSRLHFYQTCRGVVERRFKQNFDKAFAEAMRTAK